mmetsp:Transcript_54945/g.96357  ORF Transcript_54945/g.96357 Transcript_54945/m.96357 type:complete len:418 (+) Transcript_54945:176-1429(+)
MHVGGKASGDVNNDMSRRNASSLLRDNCPSMTLAAASQAHASRQRRRVARRVAPWSLLLSPALCTVLMPCPAASASPLLRSSRSSRSSLLHLGARGQGTEERVAESARVVPVAVQGESLVPDFSKSQWTWMPGNAEVPGLVSAAAAPAPGAAAAPAPAAPGAPGPAQAGSPCDELRKAGEAAFPGQFLDCKEFRYYGGSIFAQADPYGCHCSAWSVNCPFEICKVSTAWEDQCMDKQVMDMGFTGLSKMSNYLPPTSIPKELRAMGSHPDYISMCMYWRKKPPNVQLPPTNAAEYASALPSFATMRFDGIGVEGCMKFVDNEMSIGQTKTGLLAALGLSDLDVISITCGNDLTNHGADVLVEGPPNSVTQAAAKQRELGFCFQALGIQACTYMGAPAPAPAFGGPSPAGKPFFVPAL